MEKSPGFVSLIGAGPGDPELITERAAQRLEEADLVLYDALVHPALVARIRGEARFVGKRAGKASARQVQINAALVDAANAGKHVVRLKGGDPFLFGRGSEEAELLAEHGIDFEVVPGVPSPLAATAYAGISLTHRNLASSVAYITATESPAKDQSSHNWTKLATATETLVIFMGMRKLKSLMELLMAHGRDPDCPAAVIHAASLPQQKTVVATVDTLAEKASGLGLPSLIVVGDVVTLRSKLRWFDKQPLLGKHVLVPRTAEQSSSLASLLRQRGADVLEAPAIETHGPATALTESVAGLFDSGFTWALFTSANTVRFVFEAMARSNLDARIFGGMRIATVGKKTAMSLANYGLKADLIAKTSQAEGLLSALREVIDGTQERFWFPRAKDAREILVEALRSDGHEVELVTAYETRGVQGEAETKLQDALLKAEIVALTASSIVKKLHETNPKALANKTLVSIGPITSNTAESLGYQIHTEAAEAAIESLVESIELIARTELTAQ